MSRAVTGLRPTGDLSVANYVGGIKPILELQTSFEGDINLFVADLHGLTDQEPDLVNRTRLDTVRSFLAAGADPERVNIYLQSQIEEPTVMLASYLDRLVTLSELMRVPTLKEKLKDGQKEEQVTVALGRYPILMAADIFVQDADTVPVGQDQEPHIEFARRMARKFNRDYGNSDTILVEPEILATNSLRILALNSEGKMSKSSPKGAIFLKDPIDEVIDKVKKAQTAPAGEMPDVLESHFKLCEELCVSEEQLHEVDALRYAHMHGENVMGDFKKFLTARITDFLEIFQDRYASITQDYVSDILSDGGAKAEVQANSVLDRTRSSMGLV